MNTNHRILHLEEREMEFERVADLLKREYILCELAWARGRDALRGALAGGWSLDLLLVGELTPGFPAQEVLALARRRCPELPVIVLAAGADDAQAVELLRQGATEVVAGASLARLAPAVRRALKEAQDQAALRAAKAEHAQLTSLLRTVLETSTEGLLVVDLAGRITAYNRKFMALCGIPEYVMAPMELERVLQFLHDQFADPETFLNEARILGDHSERKLLGLLRDKDQRSIEVFGRSQRVGREAVGRVFNFTGTTDREPGPEASAIPPDLVEAARSGRIVPWYLTEDELVISGKGAILLGLPEGGLPRDLPGLEAMIHPDDLDLLRRGLEHPRTAPFQLRMHKGDGSWIATRWNMKRGAEGYRGVFTESAPAAGGAEEELPGGSVPRFQFKVRISQEP